MWRRAALFDFTSLNFPDIRERDLELFERNEILGDAASAKQTSKYPTQSDCD